MPKSFNEFYDSRRKSIIPLNCITNFKKITENVARYDKSLSKLDTLLSCDSFRKQIASIWEQDESTFEVLPLLLAIRELKTFYTNKLLSYPQNEGLEEEYSENSIEERLKTPESVMLLMEKTGMEEFLRKGRIGSLKDFLYGVEVGLDSNARKNRNGEVMKDYVSSVFKELHLDFCEYSGDGDVKIDGIRDKELADFLIKTSDTKYLVKVNFYLTAGSTQTKKADLYAEKADKLKALKKRGYQFVWITDGDGWKNNNAKEKLNHAYDELEGEIYNLKTMLPFLKSLKNT